MNLFDMERQALQGKHLRTKSQDQNIKLQEAFNNLKNKREEDTEINEYDMLSEQKQNIRRANLSINGSNAAIRRKTLSEKYAFKDKLTKELFINSVYDIFMEALLLDDDFKEKYQGNLYKLVEDTTWDLMNERGITLKSLKESSSLMIQNIIELCESTAEAEADAKFNVKDIGKKEILNEKDKKSKNDDEEKLISSEAKSDFDNDKQYETQSIAEAIKDKVVSVVRREQEMAEEEEEEKAEIDGETEPLSDIDRRTQDELNTDVDGLPIDSEAAEVGDDPLNDEGNSTADIERLATNPLLGAGNSAQSDEEIKDGNDADDDMDLQKTESMILHTKLRKPGMIQESLFRSLQMNIAGKSLKEQQLSEGTDMSLNMDMIFAETLAYYTLLETLHTSRIVEFNALEARNLAKEMIYRTSKPEKK